MLVSKNRFKQLVKHFSSAPSRWPLVIGLLALHFLKHISVKLWIDIWTFDLEFSDSINCMMSFLEDSSKLCNALWEIVDMVNAGSVWWRWWFQLVM